MCLRGASEVENEVLATNRDARLRAYVVWVPKVGGKESDVQNASRYVPDDRAMHFWDNDRALVDGYDSVLKLTQDAWDIYMVFGPDARWGDDGMPKPDYWMHQLDVTSAPVLDAAVLADRIKQYSETH